MVPTGVLQTSTYRNVVDAAGVGGGLLSILAPVLLYVLFLWGIRYAIRLASPTRLVESIAKSILAAFQRNGTIRSENARVEVSGTADGLRITCTLRGGDALGEAALCGGHEGTAVSHEQPALCCRETGASCASILSQHGMPLSAEDQQAKRREVSKGVGAAVGGHVGCVHKKRCWARRV